MNVIIIFQVIAIVCTGLLSGIYFSDRFGFSYIRSNLSPSVWIESQQIIHIHFVRILPFIVIGGSLACLVWTILLIPQLSTPYFWMITVATCCYIETAILTRKISVPLNKKLMEWNIANPPANLKAIWKPWETVNSIRTFSMIIALVLESIVLAI
jgi:uncharacterized membrane protein